jgi:hypothetical protein
LFLNYFEILISNDARSSITLPCLNTTHLQSQLNELRADVDALRAQLFDRDQSSMILANDEDTDLQHDAAKRAMPYLGGRGKRQLAYMGGRGKRQLAFMGGRGKRQLAFMGGRGKRQLAFMGGRGRRTPSKSDLQFIGVRG